MNLIKTNTLTKSIILNELTKIIVDHNIEIEQERLKQKINLLFDDCKGITAERFIANCELLRKKQLFGRLPANFEFLKDESKLEDLTLAVNQIFGAKLLSNIEKNGNAAKLIFALKDGLEELQKHSKKEEIKALISKELGTSNFEFGGN